MKQSEKMLLGGLGSAVVLWLGFGLVQSKLMEPIKKLQADQKQLNDDKDKSWAALLTEMKKGKEFSDWMARSLPANPNVASTVYTNWVDSLAKISGLEEIKLKPEPIKTNNIYSACPVTLTAEARLDELALFLERFESVDLMHRIDQLKVESPSNEGDPELKVTIIAEGISMKGAPERTQLFPRTELYKALAKNDPQVIVTSTAAFPAKAPFLVRIGDEILNVTEVQDGGVWSVQRGVEKSFAERHVANSYVELFPVVAKGPEAGANVVAMRSRSLFIKPAPPFTKKARMASQDFPPAVRGERWNWTLRVADWNPAFGAPAYQLISGPTGMTINNKSGAMEWNVGEQVDLGEVNVEVLVWGPNGDQAKFTPEFKLRVREPNQAPVFTAEGPLKFFIGRQSTVRVTAEDRGNNATPLRFSLQSNLDGMTIDENSGTIRWKPPENMMPGDQQLVVKVSDSDERGLVKETSKTFAVTLAEDSAQFAYLAMTVRSDEGPYVATIRDRATNTEKNFKPGDQVQIADFDMKVIEVGPTFVIFQRDDAFYRLGMDGPLVNMKKVDPPQPVSVPGADEKKADPAQDPAAARGA